MLVQQWQDTPTWMAPHAKYVALYGAPFWREQGWSGEARSACGPMVEIHDASAPGGSAALFGFVGVPARARASLPPDVLRAHCRAQLARLFGQQAALPQADFLKDWAQEPHTATAADVDGPAEHAQAPDAAASSGAWLGRLTGGAGFVLDTTVTIGYDVPWRQVQAMLVEAARRVPDVGADPAPRRGSGRPGPGRSRPRR